jgi:hypothetical protein
MDEKYITPERRAEIAQTKRLLEKREHYKLEMSLEDMQKRDEANRKNRALLVRLCNKHGLFIPQRDFDKWRPTVETTGEVEGFWHLGQLRCIATDGLQAWFLTIDDCPWIGHIGNFVWDGEKGRGAPPVRFSVETARAPKKQRLSPAAKLLKKLQEGMTK